MTTDDQTITDAAEAIGALLHHRPGASHEEMARAVFSTIPEAIEEEATLYTLKLDTVDRESAHFAAAGGFRLEMHRGEWMERGRPACIWITVQEALSAP